MRIRLPYHLQKTPFYTWQSLLVQPLSILFFLLSAALGIYGVDVVHQQVIVFWHRYDFSWDVLGWFPVGFYALVLIVGVLSFLLGRVFCGWACPHHILTEWTLPVRVAWRNEPPSPWLRQQLQKKPWLKQAFKPLTLVAAILLSGWIALLLSLYLVPMDWMVSQYASGAPHVALVFGHGLFWFLGLFLMICGHDFCRTCCPYGMAQSISAYHLESSTEDARACPPKTGIKNWIDRVGKFFRALPMEVGLKQPALRQQCGGCQACQLACPVEIDPRQTSPLKVGQFDGCFNCGLCIDACNWVQSNRPQQTEGSKAGSKGFLTFGFQRFGRQ